MNSISPRVLIITPFHKSQRGNTLTTRRILTGLTRQGLNAGLLSLEDPDYWNKLHQYLHSNRFDIIHGFNGLHMAELVKRCPQLREYPLIVTLTGTDINLAGDQGYGNLQPVLSMAKYIVVFHEHFKTRLIGHDPAFKKRIAVIPQGVCLPPAPARKVEDFGIPPGSTVFLLPTGLRPVKNLDLALDGLERLAHEDSRVYLLIMGPVIDRTYAQGILQRISTLPWATYLGEIPHTEISGILAAGDVVINCSESEGQPQAALEAMSLGIPAILSDVPGNRGIITSGREGFYIKSPGDLYRAAYTLHTQPDLRYKMGLAARELVKSRFDYSYEISQYIQLYRKMLPFRPE
ncbi:MAG: glycosyltransferase family 4 protein [Syntrophomonadaceae bacterium]|mgnify:CR=1 FL=1|jgi:glycosyltransferase involved in cell wall biosynthesis|nr:glycosyltransferase family 4 protein [Syntrophomonadaceae bacterium]